MEKIFLFVISGPLLLAGLLFPKADISFIYFLHPYVFLVQLKGHSKNLTATSTASGANQNHPPRLPKICSATRCRPFARGKLGSYKSSYEKRTSSIHPPPFLGFEMLISRCSCFFWVRCFAFNYFFLSESQSCLVVFPLARRNCCHFADDFCRRQKLSKIALLACT